MYPDLAIERVFEEDGSVLGFLKLTLSQSKVFKTENVSSFDLLCKIIELYPKKVAQYATNTIIVSVVSIKSVVLLYKIKGNGIEVIKHFAYLLVISNRFVYSIFVQCKHQQKKRRKLWQ